MDLWLQIYAQYTIKKGSLVVSCINTARQQCYLPTGSSMDSIVRVSDEHVVDLHKISSKINFILSLSYIDILHVTWSSQVRL
jgi:hypothetical protein